MPLQWEESKATYIHKRAMYYRLHQEMEGAKTQLKGWRKVSNLLCVIVLCFVFA